MLGQLPDANHIKKIPGIFPDDVQNELLSYSGNIDGIIAYSVIQYIFTFGNLWNFLDYTLSLLSPGGEILFGDIPNQSMRKRFFSSDTGKRAHRNFTGCDDEPIINYNTLNPLQIDDSVVFAMLSRARLQGFHAWVLPQFIDTPMSNRREDILIRRP